MSETAAKGIVSIVPVPEPNKNPFQSVLIPIPRNSPWRLRNKNSMAGVIQVFVNTANREVSFAEIVAHVRGVRGNHIGDASIRSTLSRLKKRSAIFACSRGHYGSWASSIAGVQPMPSAAGQIFTLKPKYTYHQVQDLDAAVASDQIVREMAKKVAEAFDLKMARLMSGETED